MTGPIMGDAIVEGSLWDMRNMMEDHRGQR